VEHGKHYRAILPANRVAQHQVHGVGRDYGSVTTTVRNHRRDSGRHHCPRSAPDSLRPSGPTGAVTRSKTLARRPNRSKQIPPWFGLPRPHSHRSRGTQRRRMRGRGNPHHGFIDGRRPLRSASHRRIIRRELSLVVTPTAPKFRVGARREIRDGLVTCSRRINVSGGG
jgi:hypothetical protein